jgi:hypothetical protein
MGVLLAIGRYHSGMKPKKKRSEDRHKKARMVRIREGYGEALDKLAELRNTTITEIVNLGIRMQLEEAHLWPPRAGMTDTIRRDRHARPHT